MKKNKKILMLIVSMFVVVIFFTGCGKKENDDKEDNDKESIMSIWGEENSDNSDDTDVEQENTDLKIGDKVLFGNYEQDNNDSNGKEPIMWQVLDIADGKALLTSCYVLDNIQYCEYAGIYGDDNIESLPWYSSYMFSWLNGDFKNMAFSDEEFKIIVDTTDYSSMDAEIIGKVFLLSYEEAKIYFELENVTVVEWDDDECEYSYSNKLLSYPTPYAIENDADAIEFTQEDYDNLVEKGIVYDSSVIGNSYSTYWLRSSLNWDSWFTAEGHALYVDNDGTIALGVANLTNSKTKYHGVRPCVWVNLDDAEEYLTIANDMEESWITEIGEEQPENNME